MIVKRGREFYVVNSREDLDGAMLNPTRQKPPIPYLDNAIDGSIPRVPIYSSVRGALAGRGAKEGEKLTVYKVFGIYPSDIIEPTLLQSPIAGPLNEYWALKGIQIRRVGEVEVGKVKETKEIPLGRLQRKYPLEFRGWKDLRPEWEQKKIPLH